MAATYPKRIDICPWLDWSHVVAGGTITRTQSSADFSGGVILQGTPAINNEIGWPVLLNAGTWTMTMLHWLSTNRGIYTHKLDSTTLGTIDGYAASPTFAAFEIASIVVATPAVYTHKLVMASKHASSTNYYYVPAWIVWRQTA